jgi:hypothetical protein
MLQGRRTEPCKTHWHTTTACCVRHFLPASGGCFAIEHRPSALLTAAFNCTQPVLGRGTQHHGLWHPGMLQRRRPRLQSPAPVSTPHSNFSHLHVVAEVPTVPTRVIVSVLLRVVFGILA